MALYRIRNLAWAFKHRAENLFYALCGTNGFFWKKGVNGFWQENSDRRYMKSAIYPAIGTYLANSKTKRVLDIGAEWYDINNKDLFCNNDIDYWIIDVNKKPRNLKCDVFLRVSILDLPDAYHNLENYFDVVISYGVLGFVRFGKKDINKYLENVFKILMQDGIFLLKLDANKTGRFEEEFQIDFNTIHKYFAPFSIADLPKEEVVRDDKTSYTFYTLRKRSINGK